MNTAAKVRERKEAHPEEFCTVRACLWRTVTRDGVRPCPKHDPVVHTEGGGKP